MLDNILKALLSGNQSADSQEENPLAELLESFLGGGASEQEGGGETTDDGLGLDDILAVVLSGGGNSTEATGNNPLLEPMVQLLSEELGLKPETARRVMSAVVTVLVGWWKQKQVEAANQTEPAPVDLMNGLDLGSLMNQNRTHTAAVASRLASQTELSEDEAVEKMESAFRLLAGRRSDDEGGRGFG